MPAPGSIRAIVLCSLGVVCAWTVWRVVSFIQDSQTELGVGTARLSQAQLWYPVPRASALLRLRSAINLDADAREVAPAATAQPFPVLLYFGGWPGTGVDNRELIRALVSHGFVVATLNDSAALPEGPMDFSSTAAYQDTLRRADARVRLLAREAVNLLDSLDSLNRHDPAARFTGRLDLSRVGIFGYSFGGAVAAQAAWTDSRFRAVLNLDGWSFGESAEQGIRQPYLYISDDTPIPTEADTASSDPIVRNTSLLTRTDYPRLLHNLARNDGVFVQITGTVHTSFVDGGRASRIRRILGVASNDAGSGKARLQRILSSYALAFFRSHLLDIPSSLLKGPSSQFPEVKFRDLRHLQASFLDGSSVCVTHQRDGSGRPFNIADAHENLSCNPTKKRARCPSRRTC